jgi:hypothetical protein
MAVSETVLICNPTNDSINSIERLCCESRSCGASV